MTRSAIPSTVAVVAWGAAAWPVGATTTAERVIDGTFLKRARRALGTLAGKTIAYMSVTGAETSRQFTLRTCKED